VKGVEEVGKLLWLLQKETDVTEVGAFADDAIAKEPLFVHDVHLAAQDKVDVLWHLASLFDAWVFLGNQP